VRAESPPTERYQALGLRKRDRIRYTVRANAEVVLQRVNAEPADDDPALAPFLALLEQDIASHPERLQPVTAELAGRLQVLVGGITVDLDGPPREDDDSISNLPSKHTV
jgi:antitoxin PrlF